MNSFARWSVAASAAALALSLGSGGAFAETKLTYGSSLPATHVIHGAGLEPFFKRVEADTNGSLKWELFTGGAMGGPKEALQTVSDNVVDSVQLTDVYLKRDLPVSVTIAEVGLLADDPLVFAGANNEMHLLACPQCVEEKRGHNMIFLALYVTGTYHLMCNKPVSTLADLQGVKVRAASRHGALMTELGAAPVSITTSEMYEAMQRGQADCTVGSTAWLKSYSLKEVVKSVVSDPIGAFISGQYMNMNIDRWKSLTDAERQAIVKNLPKLVADTVYAYNQEADDALEEAKAGGVVVSKAGPDLKAAIDKFIQGEVKVSAEKGAEAGVTDPDKLLAVFLEKVEKWRKIVAETGGDKQKYEDALWREIFSKATF